ncbi:MAG: Asp-tRNAAsn/Glu-tRNAGln amidotransferase subunit-related amidase [Collimonas fungivorans]|uniref:amidase n=1 Tax=Collimonas fungivorans TaxID=158899 RepID=UPI0026F21B92|nr:amidase [Collimonas fungivorans]MDB5765924.1 Asp-tRNAAsn/Glu-tRNAGln amidotransferase subunit-related amidase [Collimonas fungivorans]
MTTTPPTLQSLATALSQNTVSSAALTEAALQRALEPSGEGSRVFTELYAAPARAAAQASDLLRASGQVRSPIDGLPISVKDLFDVAGSTTLAGSVALRDAAPASVSSLAVQRLVAAGAVIVGRTNMTEFAFSGLGINPHYGTPRNPWDRSTGRIPGGSSSGAAVSVSDAMAVAAIGSDTGGSIRIPAALCGLTGFKPTARRVSLQGVLPLSTQLDSIGPIANSVACCATLDAILAGEPIVPLQPYSLRGLRLALPTTLVLDGMDHHVAAAFAGARQRLQAAGALIEEIEMPEFSALGAINAKGGFAGAEAYAWHRALIAERAAAYDPRVISRILRGKEISAADLIDLFAARKQWIATVERKIAGYDALLLPTVPVVAPAIAALEASDEAYFAANGLILRNPSVINFFDGCALSLPCHAAGTAPVGLMLAGAGGNDRKILEIGLAVEAALAAA